MSQSALHCVPVVRCDAHVALHQLSLIFSLSCDVFKINMHFKFSWFILIVCTFHVHAHVHRFVHFDVTQVLIATSTLAWGVNFPAHLVVVKGTEYFDGKTRRYVDFPITG